VIGLHHLLSACCVITIAHQALADNLTNCRTSQKPIRNRINKANQQDQHSSHAKPYQPVSRIVAHIHVLHIMSEMTAPAAALTDITSIPYLFINAQKNTPPRWGPREGEGVAKRREERCVGSWTGPIKSSLAQNPPPYSLSQNLRSFNSHHLSSKSSFSPNSISLDLPPSHLAC